MNRTLTFGDIAKKDLRGMLSVLFRAVFVVAKVLSAPLVLVALLIVLAHKITHLIALCLEWTSKNVGSKVLTFFDFRF